MNILVTGSEGFIGKNLTIHLREQGHKIFPFTHSNTESELEHLVEKADWVFHLAGVNRPQKPKEFISGNIELTVCICKALEKTKKNIPVVFSSSSQALLENPYGESKLEAEKVLQEFSENTACPVRVFRLPGVFGKWCRPHYNSVIATFCHQIVRGLPIQLNAPDTPIKLVYIDTVVDAFINLFSEKCTGFQLAEIDPVYETSVGEIAASLNTFREGRTSLMIEKVGVGFLRALYSTYVSYLPEKDFSYPLSTHNDPRGSFSEVLKTFDSGQFSFFTALPGVTRGGHYHHTKTEKFLVLKGSARFRFQHIHSGATHTLVTSSKTARIVETIPGWAHDVTNISDDEMIVMLWSNEVFDPIRTDTIPYPISNE